MKKLLLKILLGSVAIIMIFQFTATRLGNKNENSKFTNLNITNIKDTIPKVALTFDDATEFAIYGKIVGRVEREKD